MKKSYKVFHVRNKNRNRMSVIARNAKSAAVVAFKLGFVRVVTNATVEERKPSNYSDGAGIQELCDMRVAGQMGTQFMDERQRSFIFSTHGNTYHSKWRECNEP